MLLAPVLDAKVSLRNEFEPLQIFLGPFSLKLDHRSQGFDRERVAPSVWRNSDASAVRVAKTPMRTTLTNKLKTITVQSRNHLPSFE